MSASPQNKGRIITLVVLSLWALVQVCNVSAGQAAVRPPPDEIAMIIASSTGNLPEVKRLIDQGMDLDHHDFTGNTPLIYAARYARVDLVQFLLNHGADVNASTHWGTTALKESVRKGNRVVVRALLDAGADVDQTDNLHESAVFDAVKYRRLWAVDMLLARHAHVNIRNDQGYTPMMYAIEQHQARIQAVLVQKSGEENVSLKYGIMSSSVAAPPTRTVSNEVRQDMDLGGRGRSAPIASLIR